MEKEVSNKEIDEILQRLEEEYEEEQKEKDANERLYRAFKSVREECEEGID